MQIRLVHWSTDAATESLYEPANEPDDWKRIFEADSSRDINLMLNKRYATEH